MCRRWAFGPFVGALLLIAVVVSANANDDNRAGLKTNASSLLGNADDYTYMWWTRGVRDERRTFSIQTSRFAIQFDVPELQITHLLPVETPPEMSVALTRRNAALL